MVYICYKSLISVNNLYLYYTCYTLLHIYPKDMHNPKTDHSLVYIFKRIINLFFKGVARGKMFFLALICIFFGSIPAIDSLLLKEITNFVESITTESSLLSSYSLFMWAILYALWWESLNILWRIFDYLYLKAIPAVQAAFTEDMFNKVMGHKIDFFQENLAGDVASVISNASKSIEMIFYFLIEKILLKIAMLVFALITLYHVHPVIGNVFTCWMLLFITISLSFAGKVNELSTEFNSNRAIVTGRMVDSISNVSIVRLFSARKFERKFLKRYIDNMVTSDQTMQWLMLKIRYALGFITTLMIFGMLYYLIDLRSNNILSVGECILIITLCIAVVDDMWDITQEFGDLFEEVGALSRALSLENYEPPQEDGNNHELIVDEASIEFDNVTFQYDLNNNIFQNKNIFIPAKQRVGLVGFSGSGKTTFTKLITRLHEAQGGTISISNTNIQEVTLDSLRKNISIIPQEPILFHRTIFDNIRYGSQGKSDAEVIEAAKAAHIHDEIMKLPQGYSSECGERGNKLSIGQKQRIMIARAFLKNAPILILDEATSALDTHTESLIQKSLDHLMKDKTVLIIAHRLATLLHMDRILVFDNGDIVEDGSHDALKNNGKMYQQLWESQKKGYI